MADAHSHWARLGRADSLAWASLALGFGTYVGTATVVQGLWRGPAALLPLPFVAGLIGVLLGFGAILVRPSRGVGWKWLGLAGMSFSVMGLLNAWLIWLFITECDGGTC